MATRRRYALYAAATIAMAALGGCALVAGLFEPRPITCSNGILDPGENKIDCGGECPKCDKEACASNDECASLQCVDGHCRSPVCDQAGSDVECFQCHRCANGDDCASNLDCASGLCAGGKCVACAEDGQCPGSSKCSTGGLCVEVTCNNGVKNTTELGVDCGGECATFLGKTCADGGSGGMGTGGTGTGGTGTGGTGTGGTGTGGAGTGGMGTGGAQTGGAGGTSTVDPCTNNVKDSSETDVDCGGGTCPKCGDGKICAGNGDCVNSSCQQLLCQPSHCGNGTKELSETDVDCGGFCVTKCQLGDGCLLGNDCVSGNCVAFKCAAP